MGLWMSHLCTGPAPPGKEAPGKDPPLAGRPTPATLKMQASFPNSWVMYPRRYWSLVLFVPVWVLPSLGVPKSQCADSRCVC